MGEFKDLSPALRQADIMAYMVFYATPKSLRPEECKHSKQFMERWGCDEHKLSSYRDMPGFMREVDRIKMALVKEMNINVDKSLYEKTQKHLVTKTKTKSNGDSEVIFDDACESACGSEVAIYNYFARSLF